MQDSNTVVTREEGGAVDALFPASSVVLSSSDAGWHGISAERLQLSLETEEHHHVGHFITLQLGPPALVESKEGNRHRRIRTTLGEFTLIGANVPHVVRYNAADVLAISLEPSLLENIAGDTAPVELIPQFGAYDPQVERIGQLLKAELETGSPTGALFADALGQALAAHLLGHYSTARQGHEDHDARLSPARLRRALDYLEANLERGDLSLSELAAAAGISPYHFAREFKTATGLAPHAYLIARRVERAKDLLSRSDLPIAAIAATSGFAHQSHLNRHFKRLVGDTPARFRDDGAGR